METHAHHQGPVPTLPLVLTSVPGTPGPHGQQNTVPATLEVIMWREDRQRHNVRTETQKFKVKRENEGGSHGRGGLDQGSHQSGLA